ncbi:MAG: butyrate kinase [Treponema sp.]|nr:butyrate kinase [Treponema sp.]
MTEKKQGAFRILAFNPGSTSTKFGIYDDEDCILIETVRHDAEKLNSFGTIPGQKEFRRDAMLKSLSDAGVDIKTLDAVAGRGGLIKPIPSGIYHINDRMMEDLHTSKAAMHATCLGGLIASEIATPLGIPAYIVDPVVVDEMEPYTRLSGVPEIDRVSVFHALNQKAIARRYASEHGKKYEDLNLVIAHLGGGISVGAHRLGKVIDANNGLYGEGPFTPERSGGVPAMQLIDLCFSGKFTQAQLKKKIAGEGGVKAYLGTSDVPEVLKKEKEGDDFAKLVLDSMLYQISKEIGAMVVALECNVDAIIITGGLAYSERVTDTIKNRVSKLAKVHLYPGEDEVWALAGGALRALRGEAKPLEYL